MINVRIKLFHLIIFLLASLIINAQNNITFINIETEKFYNLNCESIIEMNDRYAIYSLEKKGERLLGVYDFQKETIWIKPNRKYKNISFKNDYELILNWKNKTKTIKIPIIEIKRNAENSPEDDPLIIKDNHERYGLENEKGESVLSNKYESIISLLDGKHYLVQDEFLEYGIYDLKQEKFLLPTNNSALCISSYENQKGVTFFKNVHGESVAFYFNGIFRKLERKEIVAAGTRYVAVRNIPKPDFEYEPAFMDTLIGNPNFHIFPEVDFEYAKSYIFNVRGNTSETASSDLGENELTKNATFISDVNDNHLELLKEALTPKIYRFNGRQIVAPTAYCYIPRDAIIFYDENDKIVATCNVCFECSKVSLSDKGFLKYSLQWEKLHQLFRIELGHPSH